MPLSGSTSPGGEASNLNKVSAKDGVARRRDAPSRAPPRSMRCKFISVSPKLALMEASARLVGSLLENGISSSKGAEGQGNGTARDHPSGSCVARRAAWSKLGLSDVRPG